MHPVLIDLGIFKIHTYGLMIALGFMVGMQLAVREARRIDLDPRGGFDQFVLDLTFWILVSSIIGSRLLFILVEWEDEYSRDPLKILQFWKGGFVFYGGLLGAVVFSVYYSMKKGRSFFLVADTLIPFVSLGQFFGRIGCFAAGCCWGDAVPHDFPLGVQFPAGSMIHGSMKASGLIDPDAAYTLHVHPVQLYESLANLCLFGVLLLLRTQKRFHGMVLAGYLFCYPLIRYGIEILRGDANRGENMLGTPFSTSQLISLGLFSVGLAIVLTQRKKSAPTAAAA
jgi:phosphatidylglycerol:prolipoprotein diacylglycerol transferase